MNVEHRIDYRPGDPILIKNIVTQLKSQGVFDQFRKECITDVDTKPAYQNLCHVVDTQVSKYLSKVKWGPDLNKTQLRENIRRHVNECSFVEPGIAIIVDQLVNPRINTVLVPKIEDIVYNYLGIRREKDESSTKTKETSVGKDKDVVEVTSNSCKESENKVVKLESSSKIGDKPAVRESKSNIKNDSELTPKDTGKPVKEPEKFEIKLEEKEEEIQQQQMDIESSDDEISPPYELHEKSDTETNTNWDSAYSDIVENPTEVDILKTEPGIEKACKANQSKIITEHEDSMDSIRSNYSSQSPGEKLPISPIEIPKTPTINYETSDDGDDYLKKKNQNLTNECSLDDAPEINFDKIEQKVIKEIKEVKTETDVKSSKEDEKPKEKKFDDKQKHNSKESSKSKSESKDKDRKNDHKDKDKSRHDKHRSEHKSRERDREKDKDKSRHDSKSYKKDEKRHRSKERDHSKSEQKPKEIRKEDEKKSRDNDKKVREDDRKLKDDERKSKDEDKKLKDEERKPKDEDRKPKDEDRKSKDEERKPKDEDRKSKDDDRKHRDEKDRKKDRKSTTDTKYSSDKKKSEDKHKHERKDHSKSKKDDSKKSRSHCNVEDKRRTDRRSSDRDSSGPSSSNPTSGLSHHSSKSDKDKSVKHKHSSSSHKTKKNDSQAKTEDNQMNEDDLELILGSNETFTQKTFHIPTEKRDEGKSDHIEDMMNEIFHPEPKTEVIEAPPVLKKPKIAKNFADIRRIMKLRKLYKESLKLKEEQGKENAESSPENGTIDKLGISASKLQKTVEYFVTKRFGKNGNSLDKCKDLTNSIIETLTDVKLNITRIDRKYSIVDGSCLISDDKEDNGFCNIVEDTNKYFNEELENIPLIIKDERATLIFEDLANTYFNPEDDKDELSEEIKRKKPLEEKANGSKKHPTQLTQELLKGVDQILENPASKDKNDPESSSDRISINETNVKEETSPLKLKIKSTFDGKNKMWACDQIQIEDPVHYLTPGSKHEEFRKYVENLEDQLLDINLENIVLEMDFPECYDSIFTEQLGAKVIRKKGEDHFQYNSEIINKKIGDKSIMLRIKKSAEQEEIKTKKRKLVDTNPSLVEDESKKAIKRKSEVKRKTLGIKRSMLSSSLTADSCNLSITPEHDESQISKADIPEQKENQVVKGKLGVKKVGKLAKKNSNELIGKNLMPSTGSNTHVKNVTESTPISSTKNKSKTSTPTEVRTDSSELNSTNVATTTRTPEEIKKTMEEKRKESIMKCYYDASDLYKPRPSFRVTSRRYRLGNTDNT